MLVLRIKHMPILSKLRYTKQKLQIGSQGDTIVEVMIAIAIVSLILAGAYRISGKSLNTVRDSQEHSQASQIAQGQLDILNSHGGLDLVASKCFDANGNQQSGSLDTCSFDSDNKNNCSTTSATPAPFCYRVVISQPHLPAQTTYRVTITWARVGGGNNTVTMDYRVGLGVSAAGIADFLDECDAHPWDVWCHQPPCQTNCVWYPPCALGDNSCYNWTVEKFNNQPLSQDPVVVSCTWDWGDGTTTGGPATDPANACLSLQRITHLYPVDNTIDPYWDGCGDHLPEYTITLTVKLSNGAKDPVSVKPSGPLPRC